MPQAASKKQYRFMMAILHGKNVKEHARGNPPKSVAAKYRGSSVDSLPESKDNDRGGRWDSGAHSKAKAKVKKEREERKKRREKVKKSFEAYYKGRGAGCIVVNDKGQLLVGKDNMTNEALFPGGHVHFNETFEEGAKRELYEEATITAEDLVELGQYKHGGNDCKVFLVTDFHGTPKDTDEVHSYEWVDANDIDSYNLKSCCIEAAELYLKSPLRKSTLRDMMTLENLQKNIIRGPETTFDVSHGDALRLVGNGAFRKLREVVKDMGDEDFKDVMFDDYKVSIRKHVNDVYSGRIERGNKLVHQFTNKSLPQVTVELMSVFEWYLPEDEPELMIIDDSDVDDNVIEGGLNSLMDNYRKHNLADIYKEIENIRSELRGDNAVDIAQVETRMMQLFDKLESLSHNMIDQHNKLCNDVGDELEELESKMRDLKAKVDELESKSITNIDAYSSKPASSSKVYNEHYFYMSKPKVDIEPSGRIRIRFNDDWTEYDIENFLNDMRAKAIKRKDV